MYYDNYAFIVIAKNGNNEFLQSPCYNCSYTTLSSLQGHDMSQFSRSTAAQVRVSCIIYQGKWRLWQFPGCFGCGIISNKGITVAGDDTLPDEPMGPPNIASSTLTCAH